MKPLRLRLESFRSYEHLDLPFPDGLFSLVGDNGAGKSSIFAAVDVALFGPESRSLAEYHSQDAVGDMEIELTFEHGEDRFRVRRSFSARGRGKSTLDFEQDTADDDPPMWLPLTCESIDATQAEIERVLGLSRETFRASNYLAQGSRSWADPSWRAGERKALLFSALGLDRTWTPALEACRADRRKLEDEGRELAGRLALLEQIVAERPEQEARREGACASIQVAEGNLAAADERLQKLAGELAAAEQEASRRREAQTRLDSARQVLVVLEAQQREAREASEQLAATAPELEALGQKCDQLPELERQLDAARARRQREEEHARRRHQLEQRVDEAERLRSQASQIQAKAIALEEEPGAVCDRCGQPLAAEARRQALDSLAAEIDALTQRVAAIDEETLPESFEIEELGRELAEPAPALAEIEEKVTAAREARSRLSLLEGRRVHMHEAAARLRDEAFAVTLADARKSVSLGEEELAGLGEPRLDLERLQRDALVEQGHVRDHRAALDAARASLARCDEALERIAKAEREIEEGQQARRDTDAELSLLADCERAVGQNGVPLFIVEAIAIPAIEQRANEILQALVCDYRVELRTQREKKTGDGLIETLDVLVIDGDGERPFETYSGGEQSRVVPALQLAVAELLAKRRGAESKVLLVDELPYLDASGTASLVALLRELTARGTFEAIGVVSHVPDLRDAFDASIQVVKSGGRSEVVA